MTIIYLTTASSSPWTVPSDWNSANNSIECIGGGGGAALDVPTIQYGAGGGGGGYSKISNLSLAPGGSVTFQVGAGGAAGSSGTDGRTGGDTWFNGTTFTGSSVGAKGGGGGQHGGASSYLATGGTGGAASSGIGSTTYSGGHGGPTTASGGDGGGGGAAGPYGNGGNGGNGGSNQSTQGGAGGGGADGGSAGSAPGGSNGGAGGTGANSGGNGGNGANADGGTAATNGGNGTEWDSLHGVGGGGGAGAGGTNAGGNGGLFGGGGGSSGVSGYGNGADGLIVITYTPALLADATMRLEASISQVGWSNGSLTAELLERLRGDGGVPSEYQVSIAQRDSQLLSESLAHAPSDTKAPAENLGSGNVTGYQVVPLDALTRPLRDNLPTAEVVARGPAHFVLTTENAGQVTAIIDALLVAETRGALGAEMTLPKEAQLAIRGENGTLDEFWITPLVQIASNRLLRSPGRARLLPKWQR